MVVRNRYQAKVILIVHMHYNPQPLWLYILFDFKNLMLKTLLKLNHSSKTKVLVHSIKLLLYFTFSGFYIKFSIIDNDHHSTQLWTHGLITYQ